METAVAGYYATDSLETQGGTLDIAAFGGPLEPLADGLQMLLPMVE